MFIGGIVLLGMFIRNFIGSLVVSVFCFNDLDDKIGIWFVF